MAGISKAERAKRRIEEAELVRRQRAADAETLLKRSAPADERPGPCRLHPSWHPEHEGLGAPTCPECIAEELDKREARHPTHVLHPHTVGVSDRGSLKERPLKPGEFESGSIAEANVLEHIDKIRAEEDADGRDRSSRRVERYFEGRYGMRTDASGYLLPVSGAGV